MTRVSVAGPRVKADISADQVVSYLLREGSGWAEADRTNHRWRAFYRAPCHAPALLPFPDCPDAEVMMKEMIDLTIERIARAESRPAHEVLAAIAGPAVRKEAGNVGAKCTGPHGPWADEYPCAPNTYNCGGSHV